MSQPESAKHTFTPAQPWLDTDGQVINAHGGGLLYIPDDPDQPDASDAGTYYWYGEIKISGEIGNTAQVGVSCYASRDLHQWENRGVALAVIEDDAHDIARGSIIERPKVVRNPKGQYVMWFHLELKGKGYEAARAGVAVSDKPEGPFEYVESFRPNDAMHRDFTLFIDDDGTAYNFFASEENATLHIAKLNDDYTRPTGEEVRVFEGRYMEAPAVCKHDGQYWFIASGCTGWDPNPARSAVADHPMGPWTELGNPAQGEGNGHTAELTFGCQSTYIQPVVGKPGAFILMLDEWRPKDPIDGRYVWLPLEFNDGKITFRWHDAWDLSVFDHPSA